MLDLGEIREAAPYTTEYTLPVEENQRIFWDEIVPLELAHATRQDVPTVVFLVGQQGAGKTRISHQIASQLDEIGGYADVDSDLYKPYHPSYQQLLEENDREMAHHTRPDSRRWMAQAEAYVRGNGRDSDARGINALVQETAQEPAAVVEKLQSYRATHRIEIAVLGVPEPLSSQGILHRYHEQVKERGHGRLTEQGRRAQALEGILEFADRIDELNLADHVALFRRGAAEPVYSNQLDADGQWQSPTGLRAAIEHERSRWTPEEKSDFLRVQSYLESAMDAEFAQELSGIAARAQDLQTITPERPQPAESSRRNRAAGLAGRTLPAHTDPGGATHASPPEPRAKRPAQQHSPRRDQGGPEPTR